jgi:hypothetical protein
MINLVKQSTQTKNIIKNAQFTHRRERITHTKYIKQTKLLATLFSNIIF